MFGKKAVLVGLMTTALVAGAAAVASATAGSGEHRTPIARGQSVLSFAIAQHEGNDIATSMNTFDPGGFSGWHSHPGTAVLVITSGQLTVYSEPIGVAGLGGGGNCSVHTYTAGQAFIERPENEENAVNTGTGETKFVITFFNVPHPLQPGDTRIDRPDPGDCPG